MKPISPYSHDLTSEIRRNAPRPANPLLILLAWIGLFILPVMGTVALGFLGAALGFTVIVSTLIVAPFLLWAWWSLRYLITH